MLPSAASTNREQDPTAPSAAETARTILDLSESGTLCTSQSDGTPLGTYTTFVLDQLGQPILRLRSDAVHTANLSREPRCSLFVQPSTHPARLLARATLIGIAEPADEVHHWGPATGSPSHLRVHCVSCRNHACGPFRFTRIGTCG